MESHRQLIRVPSRGNEVHRLKENSHCVSRLWLSGTDDPCEIRKERLGTGGAFLQSADLNQTPLSAHQDREKSQNSRFPKAAENDSVAGELLILQKVFLWMG